MLKKISGCDRQRRPEKTVLLEVIKKHRATWHKEHEKAEDPVPYYIFKEFQKYLGCGILAKDFACAHCEDCRKDFLIAFSCKGRGICPSCNTRAMVETAAHVVENVLPRLPFRQFVISFPMRIRHYFQTHEILQSVLRIVVSEIRKRLIACCSPDVSNPLALRSLRNKLRTVCPESDISLQRFLLRVGLLLVLKVVT